MKTLVASALVGLSLAATVARARAFAARAFFDQQTRDGH